MVRELSPRESVRALCRYINDLVEEDTYLLVNKKVSLKEERKWLKARIEEIGKGKAVHLVAEWNGRIVGACEARSDKGRETANANIGIAVSKDFRGVGLGEFLLKGIINLAKKRLKPSLIYLTLLGPNKPARKLYEKLGFREVARLPKWTPFKRKRVDRIFMVLNK